ncbi:nitrate reductase cytochrome c-type subunit [Campylobacter gastrosuis]|uniref:Periplasmic nitrate reductase, electron transfer subunit n=1 Tax=Campylobacter gastrosuis TaxID=2974576 RepID=A0ABT7HQ23_9BACT|nr:nitrate reductase cytochrome c-type subunit [Campylobacter gastrosuis]MDL0088994.1 nitrate reductase cytochrome c-type subunit [Campylobacter gastrosuis]
MKFKAISAAFLAIFLAACAISSKQVSDDEIGLRKISLLDEQDVSIKDINWTAQPAGMSKKLDRSFENAPPFISHDIEGMVPITKDLNMCTTCHLPEFAKDAGATPVPKSHLYDLRNNKDKGGVLHDERFVCTTCHVPQANVNAPKANSFKADFRDKNGNTKSNLLEVLNDGVK